MSKNSPYEQDSGVLSTILGTTALAGLGYASYTAVSDPTGFEEALTKVFNRVFPVVTQDPNAFQARNMTANNAIREGERIASIARKNSFVRAAQRRSNIANSFVISNGIDSTIAEQAYAMRGNVGSYDFTDWSHAKGFDGEDRLVKAVNEITSGRGYKYSFNGTTMEFDLGGNNPLKLHIPKFHDDLGVWLAKEDNKTLRVHRAQTVAYNKTAKEYQLIKGRNPIEEVSHTLENPLKLLTVINRDIDTNGYDIRKIRQLVGAHPGYYDLPLAEKQKVVNEVVHGLKRDGLLYNSNLKTDFTNLSQRELQDVFNHVTMEQGRYVAHDEVARMQFFGMQGKISDYSRIINEDNFQQIGVGNLEAGAATTGEDIKRFYGNILSDLGYKDAGWYLNQDMTQKGVFSMISPHTAIGQSEQFKGISKGVKFYDNLAAKKTVTGRTAPLIKNPDARNVPKYFINDEPVVNLLSVIDPTIGPETILLNQEVGNNMKVVTSKTYNLRSMVRKVKDVSGGNHSDINVEWASGKTQPFNSLDDFYRHVQNKDLDVTKAIKRVSFNKSTVFGLNNGNDIINKASDIAMAREIGMTGNPVLSEARGFISGENAAKGFRSWLAHSAGKSPVTQLTVSLVEDAKKMSETTTKLRTSVSLLDPEAPMGVAVNPVVDVRKQNRVNKIVEGLSSQRSKYVAEKDKLLSGLGVTGPGIISTEENYVRVQNEMDAMFANFHSNDEFKQINTNIVAARKRKAVLRNKLGSLEEWFDNYNSGNRQWGQFDRQDQFKSFVEHYKNVNAEYEAASNEVKSLYETRVSWAESNGNFDKAGYYQRRDQLRELRDQRSRLYKKHGISEKVADRLNTRIGIYGSQIDAARTLDVAGSVDAYQSWSWFKGTIMKGSQLGKNSPEYLSFLQSSILGHIAYGQNDLTVALDSDTMKMFEKMAHIPDSVKTKAVNGVVSVRSMINHPEFRMLQRGENFGEQVISAQRMLASLRSGAAYHGKVLSSAASTRSLTRLYQVMEEVKDGRMDNVAEISGKNAWAYLSSYVGNETTSTSLGIGENRFAFGLKEAHLLRRNQGILKELSMFNKVDTASIYDWGFKTLNSISGDLDVAKEGIKILGSENAEELIGKDVAWLEQSASNLKLPEVRMNTMFGDSSISPDGFAVRVTEEDGKIGTRFIAPSDFWGVNHYIGDKDMVTSGEDMMSAAELVRDALIRGGKDNIASKEVRKKFDEVQQRIHTNFAKGGFTRTGAIQVETATYDSNVVAHSSLGNDRLMRNLERSGGEASELRYILGNSVFQSDELYRSTLRAKLEHADASRGQLTLASHVKNLFGEESRIAKAVTDMGGDIGKTVSLMSQESIELSKRITKAAHTLTTKENLLDADIAQIKDLVRDIKSSADIGLYLRDPVLYPHSGVRAFTFATDAVQIAQDKMLSGGDIIATLMNMDNDGDKIKQFMLLSADARKEAIADMMKEQRVSYSVLTSMKKSPLAKPAGHWINGKGGAMRAVEESEAEAFEAAARSLGETEGAIAAYSLKALTGSVDVRTHGLVSHILSTAKQRGFSEEEVREMELFAGNTIPLTLVQDAISSKHIARSINNADSRLLGMLKNIGGITEEEFKKNLKASGGDIDVLSFMTITNKLNSNRNDDRWVKQGVEHLDTLLAVSRNYKTVSETQYRKAVEWIGYNTQESKDGWDRLLVERQKVASELGEDAAKGLFERGGAVEKYGFIGFQEYAKGIGNRELKKLQMEFNKLSRNAGKGQSEQEIAMQALRNITNTFGERAQASREIFTGVDLVSHRTMIGLKETMGFVKEHLLNHPTRMLGVAGLAMVGTTAVNMLFGDATPMSPNDLPSVNNPSFRDNRYNNMLENRQLNNVPNANVSSGLLTDSSNSYDSVMNHLQSNFGSHYSSVSVRHDGQDPYKEHMMRYNM